MRRACVQVNQQQQCEREREWDRQVSERTNKNVHTIHKQQYNRYGVLEKARI